MDAFSRSEMLLGPQAMARLRRARVAVFGVGGVGGYVVEALARSAVGSLTLIDGDVVALTNINRQLCALRSTLGQPKVEVLAHRVRDINPDCRVEALHLFYGPDTAEQVDFGALDYVVDAVDTVSAKILIIQRAKAFQKPVISAMGAGNKLNPAAFEIADIAQTSVCPLARVMRKELKQRGLEGVKVLYSREPALTPAPDGEEGTPRRPTPGSVAFVPSVAGLMIAGEVVRDLCEG